MDRKEIADVIPSLRIVTIVKLDQGRRRLTQTVDERIRECACFNANDLECGRFEWFDKADCVADADNVADPIPAVTAGAEFY